MEKINVIEFSPQSKMDTDFAIQEYKANEDWEHTILKPSANLIDTECLALLTYHGFGYCHYHDIAGFKK